MVRNLTDSDAEYSVGDEWWFFQLHDKTVEVYSFEEWMLLDSSTVCRARTEANLRIAGQELFNVLEQNG